VTVNIDQVLEDDTFFNFALLDEFIIDLLPKAGKLLRASCRLSIATTL